MLDKSQYIGAAILLVLAAGTWLFVALYPQKPLPVLPDQQMEDRDSLRQARWEHKKDSMRRADSLRWDEWTKEQNLRYDSFRLAYKARRDKWVAEREHYYDSLRIVDSLWRDSMGIIYPHRIKKDTFLDLNHCDTTALQYIRGIGRYTAIRIVEYREQLGGYYSPAQLKDEYFSKLTLDTLLYRFSARPEDVRMIDVNNCNTEELNRHPYLRFKQAKAIYELRRKYIRLNSIEDLRRLNELDSADLQRLQYYLRFE